MIEALGWIALAFGGGYAVFVGLFLLTGGGSLEGAIQSFFASIFCAVAWVIFIAWLSPLSISFGVN
ncbi:MAG: hypothetical protein AAFZ46_13135 [Pseudomonadota bacterium]